jgi:glycosyltransferase involved in cell wall biosynthesis
MTPTVAIVVCSRDRPQLLATALAALAGQPADELLVVDSASTTDATATAAAAAGIRCIRVERPGLARARNAALRATTADVVAFTDDDCEPEPGWVDAIRSSFDERIGFVLGRVVALGSDEQPAVQLDTDARVFGPGDDVMTMGHGANFAVARTAWSRIGGFDELLGVGARFRAGEDTDFLWRTLQAGFVGRFVENDWVLYRRYPAFAPPRFSLRWKPATRRLIEWVKLLRDVALGRRADTGHPRPAVFARAFVGGALEVSRAFIVTLTRWR